MVLSVNQRSLLLIEEMAAKSEELKITCEQTATGATVIDAGINAVGGYTAGRYATEICMGNLGDARISTFTHGGLTLPSIEVTTDFPGIALFGAQFAGWRISVGKYFAMGSGPARALALKPKELYEKIGYQDDADTAVLVLETSERPTDTVVEHISEACGVASDRLYLLLTPTASLAGSTQISGRIVETGLHKLTEVGFDPKKVLAGYGSAPIAPIHPKSTTAMGRTNDMLLYAGTTYFTVEHNDDDELKELIKKVPSSSSKDYGQPFAKVFKAAGYDFYKIDPGLFAPAVIVINNIVTGKTYRAGRLNLEVLQKSIGLS
jgi:methenyltetrahydromethanopterin cyclohydrolase